MTIHIIGLGVDQPLVLSQQAQSALQVADIVLGSSRQLALVDVDEARQVELPKLAELSDLISKYQGKQVAVLASGDPLHYGIGAWFARHYTADQLTFYPAVSSIQSICHYLQLSQQDVEVISLHGRPLAKIRRYLKANRHYVVLTDQYSQPQILAQECAAAGLLDSTIWVGEQLGYSQQKVQQFSVANLREADTEFDPLHVSVIHTQGVGGVLPEFPGIPDEDFITDGGAGRGLITKREIRLSILSLLQPTSGDVIWDIGAGCGGVAVELAYWNDSVQVEAIESHGLRLDCLHQNCEKFGVVENLRVVDAIATEVMADLPQPNKVFVGGSGGQLQEILSQAWQRLIDNGLMVISAVTEDTKQGVSEFIKENNLESESMQLAVSRQSALAGHKLYRPALPVTLFKVSK